MRFVASAHHIILHIRDTVFESSGSILQVVNSFLACVYKRLMGCQAMPYFFVFVPPPAVVQFAPTSRRQARIVECDDHVMGAAGDSSSDSDDVELGSTMLKDLPRSMKIKMMEYYNPSKLGCCRLSRMIDDDLSKLVVVLWPRNFTSKASDLGVSTTGGFKRALRAIALESNNDIDIDDVLNHLDEKAKCAGWLDVPKAVCVAKVRAPRVQRVARRAARILPSADDLPSISCANADANVPVVGFADIRSWVVKRRITTKRQPLPHEDLNTGSDAMDID